MGMDTPAVGLHEQLLLQRCHAAGLGHWAFAFQAIIDRLRGLEEYIDDAADCPVLAVARSIDEAAACDPLGRDKWLLTRLARLRCFYFHAACEDRRWDPTVESFRMFAARGDVQVWEDVFPNPERGRIEAWLQLMRDGPSA